MLHNHLPTKAFESLLCKKREEEKEKEKEREEFSR